jgi:hypothetical protein
MQWRTQDFSGGGGGGVRPRIFSGGGGSTNSVEDRGQREWGSGGGSPLVMSLQMNETHILIRLLRMYIPRNWVFGSALAKLRNYEGGAPRYATEYLYHNNVTNLIHFHFHKHFIVY